MASSSTTRSWWPPFGSSSPPAVAPPPAPPAPPCGAELSGANEQLVALTSAIEQLIRGLPRSDDVEQDVSIIHWKFKQFQLLIEEANHQVVHVEQSEQLTWMKLLKCHRTLCEELRDEFEQQREAVQKRQLLQRDGGFDGQAFVYTDADDDSPRLMLSASPAALATGLGAALQVDSNAAGVGGGGGDIIVYSSSPAGDPSITPPLPSIPPLLPLVPENVVTPCGRNNLVSPPFQAPAVLAAAVGSASSSPAQRIRSESMGGGSVVDSWSTPGRFGLVSPSGPFGAVRSPPPATRSSGAARARERRERIAAARSPRKAREDKSKSAPSTPSSAPAGAAGPVALGRTLRSMEEGRSRRSSSASIVYSRSNDIDPDGSCNVPSRWAALRDYTSKHKGCVALAVTIALLLVAFGIVWSQDPSFFTSGSEAALLVPPIGHLNSSSSSSSTGPAWSSTGGHGDGGLIPPLLPSSTGASTGPGEWIVPASSTGAPPQLHCMVSSLRLVDLAVPSVAYLWYERASSGASGTLYVLPFFTVMQMRTLQLQVLVRDAADLIAAAVPVETVFMQFGGASAALTASSADSQLYTSQLGQLGLDESAPMFSAYPLRVEAACDQPFETILRIAAEQPDLEPSSSSSSSSTGPDDSVGSTAGGGDGGGDGGNSTAPPVDPAASSTGPTADSSTAAPLEDPSSSTAPEVSDRDSSTAPSEEPTVESSTAQLEPEPEPPAQLFSTADSPELEPDTTLGE